MKANRSASKDGYSFTDARLKYIADRGTVYPLREELAAFADGWDACKAALPESAPTTGILAAHVEAKAAIAGMDNPPVLDVPMGRPAAPSEGPTPRTDTALFEQGASEEAVPADFARQLERELAEVDAGWQECSRLRAISESELEASRSASAPRAWLYECTARPGHIVPTLSRRDWAESGTGLWIETPLYAAPVSSTTPLDCPQGFCKMTGTCWQAQRSARREHSE